MITEERLKELETLGRGAMPFKAELKELVNHYREAKETEPLRREVAILCDESKRLRRGLADIANETEDNKIILAVAKLLSDTQAISNPQSTALAYDQGVKAKALEEFGEKYRCVYLIHRGAEIYVGPKLKELADKEAADIRASKGE